VALGSGDPLPALPSGVVPDRPLISEAAAAAHDRAVAAGHDGYMDPDSGLFVMTARYLHERGYCCTSGCRHCPWQD